MSELPHVFRKLINVQQLNIDYKPVNQNDAYTIGIDLSLEGLEDDRSLAGKSMTLANGFRGSNSVSRTSDDFKGTFSRTFCPAAIAVL